MCVNGSHTKASRVWVLPKYGHELLLLFLYRMHSTLDAHAHFSAMIEFQKLDLQLTCPRNSCALLVRSYTGHSLASALGPYANNQPVLQRLLELGLVWCIIIHQSCQYSGTYTIICYNSYHHGHCQPFCHNILSIANTLNLETHLKHIHIHAGVHTAQVQACTCYSDKLSYWGRLSLGCFLLVYSV